MSSEEDKRYDGILMTIIQQKGNIEGFFEVLFGFLRRSTDFYLNQKKAEEIIVNSCKKQYDIFAAEKTLKMEKEKEKKEREEARKQKLEHDKKIEEAIKQVEKQEEQAVKKEPESQLATEEKPAEEQKEKKEEDEKPPIGNGGKTDKYIWTQTLEELQIYVPVPEGTNKKSLNINITTKRLLVQIKGQPAIIDGEFKEQIHADESLWIINTGEIQDYKGTFVHFTIEKWNNQMHWWDCAIKGDTTINTQKIQPESSNLSDLDGETKSTVEKMMFDMRQKQAGLPTSDELQKRDKLSEFMKAHPEMDFSKCKFN